MQCSRRFSSLSIASFAAFTMHTLACSSGSIDDAGGDEDGGGSGSDDARVGGDETAASGDAAASDTRSTVDSAKSDPCVGRADGNFCDGDVLVHCKGGVTSTTDKCASWCAPSKTPGADVCADNTVDPCFDDPDGVYCGGTIGGDAVTLYTCKDKHTAKADKCATWCYDAPAPEPDKCADNAVDACFDDADGTYCGAKIGGDAGKLYHCKDKHTAAADACGAGCADYPPSMCHGELACGHLQWWNTALTYGPYHPSGSTWWDTDLAVSSSTPVQLRHDSRLDKEGVYGWGWMPEWTDMVTGHRFRYLHLRPSAKYTTAVGTIYPAGTVVGISGGDTADTGLPTYSTGAHLCIQTLDLYRDCFPTGKDTCK